jgi:hypothetical protein
MKVLFIGSNAPDEETLALQREITELQRRFVDVAGEPVSFQFYPNLAAEDLPSMLARHKPDVLHISAHGDTEQLSLATASGKTVRLDAQALKVFLQTGSEPKVVYLNACDSHQIAERLAGVVPIAIGTTAPITNGAARNGAVAFYERILAGHPVGTAFEVSRAMIELLQNKEVSAVLYSRPDIDIADTYLHRAPRLVADFLRSDPQAKKGWYRVRFGVHGCPTNVTQIVFFSDDPTLIDESYDDQVGDLCLLARGMPRQGVLWVAKDEYWEVKTDHRLFAMGVLGDGTSFTCAGRLTTAIETRFLLSSQRAVPSAIAAAVGELRRLDGSELEPTVRPPAKAKPVEK